MMPHRKKRLRMIRTQSKYDKDEFARRGEELFEREIRAKVTGEDPRKMVLIDIESGDFEVDFDELAASDRLRARHPEAQVWMRRVGSRISRRIGGVRTFEPQ